MKLSRNDLKTMYETMSIKDIMAQLGLNSPSSLYLLLDEAGIPRKRTGINPRTRKLVTLTD